MCPDAEEEADERRNDPQPAQGARGSGGSGGPPPQPAVRNGADCDIPGLTLHLDFVTPEEEEALLRVADLQAHWQVLARRRVLQFGAAFDYETRGVCAAAAAD